MRHPTTSCAATASSQGRDEIATHTSAVYYLAPDFDVPSWGTALLYHHVRLLRQQGINASVLHHHAPFRMSWIDVDVPISYLSAGFLKAGFRPAPSDVVVVPEVLAHAPEANLKCRRVVFVQGSFLMLNAFPSAIDYRELGYEAAMVVMPHISRIVSKHFGMTPAIVPPFVASYFFVGAESLHASRPKTIVLAGKPDYRQAGYMDFDIAHKILRRHLADRPDWEIVVLSGLTHRETAQLMQRSAILVNLNTLESFNATVPEAMAAGCAVWCYDAFGGQDLLRPGVNARVWPNNHIYPLLDDLCSFVDDFNQRHTEDTSLRRAAYDTACQYQEAQTTQALLSFYEPLLRLPAPA